MTPSIDRDQPSQRADDRAGQRNMLALLVGATAAIIQCGLGEKTCTHVDNSSQLQAALADTSISTIVLGMGQFDSASPCQVTNSVTVPGVGVNGSKSGLCITRDVTLLASTRARTALSVASSEERVLYVAKSASVTIHGVDFSGGSASWGGSILNEGELRLTDFNIYRGQSVWGGGGLCNLGTASLLAGTITRNKNKCSSSLPCVGGGGIANGYEDGYHTVKGCKLGITGVVFEGNSAGARSIPHPAPTRT